MKISSAIFLLVLVHALEVTVVNSEITLIEVPQSGSRSCMHQVSKLVSNKGQKG